MVDIPGSSATTATISTGGTVTDSLEAGADRDWFRIELTSGQQISVALDGITLDDPYLRIRNAAGTIIYQNDDGGAGLDALLSFQAPSTGTYYIDVGAALTTQTGTYQLSVTPYTLPPLGTVDQFADWMVNGFWSGDSHHFDVTQGGTITVNLTALTADGRSVARAALQLWTDVIGVTFTEVASGGQIQFDDLEDGTGAFSDGVWSGGITTSAIVNVSPSRLGIGPGIVRGGLQTYIHEIGHALGLGHAGDYNGGTAFSRYPYEATYINDGAALSMMSYFDNGENSYYDDLGFSNLLVATPQIADIAAAELLYGLSTNTRTGNTTYGFNNTSGREIFDAALHPALAYTIVDSGGTDTLDYSGFTGSQRINLNPETFSNVGQAVGNVSIARGTVIENAIGGSGADTLIGNGANNVLSGRAGLDSLSGGTGADIFRDTKTGLNGDTITDFGAGDSIVITDAAMAGFTFNLNGSTLTFSGGTLTFGAPVNGSIVASAAAGGGVQLTMVADARDDFNGDGLSDVLWRNGSGALAQWLGQAGGTFAYNGNAAYQLSTDWSIAAFGDFNGDNRDDVLWRNNDGALMEWLGQASGTFAWNPNVALQLGVEWELAGVGDFNGDNRDDVLWRNDDGALSQWLGQANGAFAWNPNAAYQLGTEWQMVGSADFNGDNRTDILWRNGDGVLSQWLGQANGGFAYNGNAAYQLGSDWQVAATGDFDGDNRDDLLWRNGAGVMSEWLAQADGTFAYNPNAAYHLPTEWTPAVTGDFNGDGRDDIIWRNEAGVLSQWLGQPGGTFAYNPNAAYQLSTAWHVQPETASLL